MIYLVCGLPGSGKTTFAKMLAKRLNAERITTEDVRHSIFGSRKEDTDFTKQEIETVYQTVFTELEKLLYKGGRNLVVDGVFRSNWQRNAVKRIAGKFRQKTKIIEVVCSDRTAKERLLKRKKTRATSPAGWKARLQVKESFETIKEKHFIVDSEKNLEEQLKRVLNK